MIDAVAPFADSLIVTKDSNKDGRFTKIAAEDQGAADPGRLRSRHGRHHEEGLLMKIHLGERTHVKNQNHHRRPRRRSVGFAAAPAQAQLTTPKQQFGFNIGDDYQLINYTQLLAFWKKLATESDRMTLVNIGTSSEGRPMVMAIITSPKNKPKLDLYKNIAKTARPGPRADRGRGPANWPSRAKRSSGSTAASTPREIVGSQQLIELVWQMVSRTDAETLRILDDVILLAVPVNPDGLELVANWYMREKDPRNGPWAACPGSTRSTSGTTTTATITWSPSPRPKS